MVKKEKLKPFIDKSFKLDEIPKEHEYIETARKRENVIVDILK